MYSSPAIHPSIDESTIANDFRLTD